ncbi:radical SAM protein [Candidatus Magnetominusculus xianensis]|uniref:Radical SAM protein n=1 Tax=Candidatus Magnetominusculus xianensis TaxID=1748249 RepID=A0ABR5SEI1_9BACT|nr:radical SAM protein [Candidatus Magnetominusculus xianensis]KWT82523.1 radical SAM protein [Candidatus Magnetominusculus xianensis]MBF0405526.1 SPASM domain-containing protein [Nitrospirota bacterium]
MAEAVFLIRHNLKKYIRKLTGSLPLMYNLGISSVCNLRCSLCTRDNYEQQGFADVEKLKIMIGEIPTYSIVVIVDLGETFLHTGAAEIFSELKKRHIWVDVFTNGTIICEALGNVLKNIDRIRVSVDTVNADRANILRRNLNLVQLKENLIKMRTIRDHVNIPVELSFATTISSHNYMELMDIVYFLAEVRFDSIFFNLQEDWSPYGNNREGLSEPKMAATIKNELNGAIQFCHKHDIFTYQEPSVLFNGKDLYENCRWTVDEFLINWSGYMLPCCLRRDYRVFNLGNVYADGSLSKTLSSDIVKNFHKSKRYNQICKNCNKYQ